MSDVPGRSAFGSDDRVGAEDDGWGSPVPAQYGSLRSVRPPEDSTDGPEGDGQAAPEAVAEADGHDRWAVTSLLRRLSGDGRGTRPAPVEPEPDPGSAPAVAADRPSRGPVGRNVRWYEDPSPPAEESSHPSAPSAPDTGFAEPGPPMPAITDTTAMPTAFVAGAASSADAPAASAAPASFAASPGSTAAPTSIPEPEVAPGPVDEPTVTAAGIDPAVLGPGLADPATVLGGRRRRRRPGRIRTRATVRHLDIGTVIRVSLVFWLLILVALVVASLLLWLFADAFGSLPSIEKSVRTLFSLKSFQLHPGSVAMYTAAGGVVIAVAGMIGTVIFALIYNLIADVVGGIRVELESFSPE